MYWIAIALAVLGLLLLLVGFARNRRGMLAVAGALLFVAGSLGGFLDRWVNTAHQAEAEARALRGMPPAPTAPGTLQTPAPMDAPPSSPSIAPPATPATTPPGSPQPPSAAPVPVPAPAPAPAIADPAAPEPVPHPTS
jgi:hypothetical protein